MFRERSLAEKRNPLKCVLNFILTPWPVFNRFLFSFSSSPTHIVDWHLIFPGCEGKEMRNRAMKQRANENVKTQNDWSLHATLRNDRGGPKDSIFVFLFAFLFLFLETRKKNNKWSAQVFKVSLPPISARAWRSVENMLFHIMIGSFQLISEKQWKGPGNEVA